MQKKLKLNKVPVSSLIQILKQLFEDGADYIDIEGEPQPDAENDIIKVTVRPEYYVDINGKSEEKDDDPEYLFTEQPYKEPEPEIERKPLSDEDINDLI
jgi:hypothetical protein